MTKGGYNSPVANLQRIICFNCGGIGHTVQECFKPKNNDIIKLCKSIMLDNCSKEKGKVPDPIRVPPKKKEPHFKYIEGVLKFWCRKKGSRKWGDHKTAEHPPHISDNPSAHSTANQTDQGGDKCIKTQTTPPSQDSQQKDGPPSSLVTSG